MIIMFSRKQKVAGAIYCDKNGSYKLTKMCYNFVPVTRRKYDLSYLTITRENPNPYSR